MISVAKAHQLIEKESKHLRVAKLPLSEAVGHIVAKDIFAPLQLPVADNSAMDGFVFRSQDTKGAAKNKLVKLRIRGDIRAGDTRLHILQPGGAFRIMTGAVIPRKADTVLPKERADVQGKYLCFDNPAARGKHIRYAGEEVAKGELVIVKHSKINPATVGILAMLGIDRIRVFERPAVSILATGSELVSPGRKLKPGQIYDSNSHMMVSVLHDMGIAPVHVRRVPDQPQKIRERIQLALKQSDVVMVMGGVSVGDYDFAKDILADCGVKTVFWRIKQKPGKPLYFGKRGKTLVFGLPGNPASVFTCFYQYVYPALRRLSGTSDPYLRRVKATVQKEIRGDVAKQLFLKSKMDVKRGRKKVEALGRQGSHMLTSLQDANSFLVVPPRHRAVKKGENVEVHLLPYGKV